MEGEMNFVFGCAQLWNLYIQIPAYVRGIPLLLSLINFPINGGGMCRKG